MWRPHTLFIDVVNIPDIGVKRMMRIEPCSTIIDYSYRAIRIIRVIRIMHHACMVRTTRVIPECVQNDRYPGPPLNVGFS